MEYNYIITTTHKKLQPIYTYSITTTYKPKPPKKTQQTKQILTSFNPNNKRTLLSKIMIKIRGKKKIKGKDKILNTNIKTNKAIYNKNYPKISLLPFFREK